MRETPVGRLAIASLFITALVTAQLTASKILAFTIPVSLPITGNLLVLPGASLGIAVMFFATDCYSELYGRREATVLVNVGFVMNFVLLALVWSTILAPAAQASIDPQQFKSVIAAGTNIVIGSLAAYLVSQNWDVYVFHRIRQYTNGEKLWLRNIGSTASSQLIDTLIFVTVAFYVAPQLFDFGVTLPGSVIAQLIVGQYLLKLLIAVVDTPFVYLVTRYIRDTEFTRAPTADF